MTTCFEIRASIFVIIVNFENSFPLIIYDDKNFKRYGQYLSQRAAPTHLRIKHTVSQIETDFANACQYCGLKHYLRMHSITSMCSIVCTLT